MALLPEITDFYDDGDEAGRLGPGRTAGVLELLRTQELLRPHLPPPPAAVLDVGGGPGIHARWLTEDGHRVLIVDPVERHVRQARERGLTATVGDARHLAQPDGSYDAVLMLGPLYHLPEPADRERAWQEARRVVRPGGLVAAAALNRYAKLLDLEADHAPELARTGLRHRPDGPTTCYHAPADLAREARSAGLVEVVVHGVHGPASAALRAEARRRGTRDLGPEALRTALAAARCADAHPELAVTSLHLLALARRPVEA
ncbi:class I SAM-dependent methyltransferase [Kitasatospora sp. NPDC048365]|uniref:class I SAM-dependent methyltransferase n=1 Tax=Kitasatospora sp. NPDC048365 TaxID=3364050 RepID=UPI0037133316